ncbi:MAG: LPS-assembly protein LptD [Rhodobacteraceae bacterium]|nr:MAG: LPS-assembly protein LptD [Paracoccaceae bacterium]
MTRRLRACALRAWLGLGLAVLLAALPLARAQAQDMATLLADRVFIDSASRLIAEGNVEALFGTTRLQARRVSYDRTTDQLVIEGPLVISDGADVVILADGAELSDGLQRGLIRSARVVFDQQLQIAAARVERLDERFTEMTSVVASSCEICAERPTPLWEIRARRVVHDEENLQVHFENAQLRLFGLPVLYVPRLRVPDPRLTRATGFLAPRFSFDTGHGLGLRAPYFIVLGTDRDLLLTPFVATRGTRALELRYRQAFATGRLELGGLVARDAIRPDRNRGFAQASGDFALGRGTQLRFNLIAPSDRGVLEDYGRGEPRLTSDITLERITRDTRARAQLLQFRSLRLRDTNAELPNQVGQAVIEHRRDVPGLGGVAGLRLEAHVHRRSRAFVGLPEPLPGFGAGPRPRQTERVSLDLDWRRDAILPGGVLGAGALHLGLDHIRLSDTGGVFDRAVTRVTPNVMAELRWPLVRRHADGVSHVIEPVAQVIWGRDRRPDLPNEASRMPELDEGNLFSLDRFAGRDIREAGLRGNLGISWTRHDPDGWSSRLTLGRVWRGADLGQFSDATPLAGRQSDWLVAVSVDMADGLSLSNRSHFDDGLALQRTGLELDWTAPGYTISTSYMRILRNDFEARSGTASEWSFEGSREITDLWTGQIGWRYDVTQQQLARAQVGLTYQNDCLRVEMGVERRFDAASSTGGRTSFGLNLDLLGIGGNPTRARRACADQP